MSTAKWRQFVQWWWGDKLRLPMANCNVQIYVEVILYPPLKQNGKNDLENVEPLPQIH